MHDFILKKENYCIYLCAYTCVYCGLGKIASATYVIDDIRMCINNPGKTLGMQQYGSSLHCVLLCNILQYIAVLQYLMKC